MGETAEVSPPRGLLVQQAFMCLNAEELLEPCKYVPRAVLVELAAFALPRIARSLDNRIGWTDFFVPTEEEKL